MWLFSYAKPDINWLTDPKLGKTSIKLVFVFYESPEMYDWIRNFETVRRTVYSGTVKLKKLEHFNLVEQSFSLQRTILSFSLLQSLAVLGQIWPFNSFEYRYFALNTNTGWRSRTFIRKFYFWNSVTEFYFRLFHQVFEKSWAFSKYSLNLPG